MAFTIDRLNWIIKKLDQSGNVHLIVNEPELELIADCDVWIEISDELIRRGLCHEAIQALDKAEFLIKQRTDTNPDWDLRTFYVLKAETIIEMGDEADPVDAPFFYQIGLDILLKITQNFLDDDNQRIWRKIAEIRCALGQNRHEVLRSLVKAFDKKGELKRATKLSDNLVKAIGYADCADVISLIDLADMQLISNDDGAMALELYGIALRNLDPDRYRHGIVRLLQNFIMHALEDLDIAMDEIAQ